MGHASHVKNSVSAYQLFYPYLKFWIKIYRSKFRKWSIIAYEKNIGSRRTLKYIFFEILLIIPTKCLEFCCTGYSNSNKLWGINLNVHEEHKTEREAREPYRASWAWSKCVCAPRGTGQVFIQLNLLEFQIK